MSSIPDAEHPIRTIAYSAEKLQCSLLEHHHTEKSVLLTTQNIITNTGAALATLALANGHLMQNQIGAQIREFSYPHNLSDRFSRGNPIVEVGVLFDVGVEREVDNHFSGGRSPKPVYYFREPEFALKIAVAAYRIAHECPTINQFLPTQTERSSSSASTLETLQTVARCLYEKGCVISTDVGRSNVWNKLLTELKEAGVLEEDQYAVSLAESPSRLLQTAAPVTVALQVEQAVAQELTHASGNVSFKELQEKVVQCLAASPRSTVLATINRLRTSGKIVLTSSSGYVLPKDEPIEPIYKEPDGARLSDEYPIMMRIIDDPLRLSTQYVASQSFEVHTELSAAPIRKSYPNVLTEAIHYFVNRAEVER